MKKSTGIFLLLFVITAVSLFVVIYVMPRINGDGLETIVLESEALPVSESEEVFVVRNETLYASGISGAPSYQQADGEKIRKGTTIMAVGNDAASEEGDNTNAAENRAQVREVAGGALVVTGDFTAAETSVVCYAADGYEKKLTPGVMAELKYSDVKDLPEKAQELKGGAIHAGDPVYKLTDSGFWYLIYWVSADSGRREHYDIGNAVKVDFGGEAIPATVDSITDADGDFRIILKCDRYYKNMTTTRHAKVSIIFSEYNGLVVDATAIAFRSGQSGLYVKQRSGSFKWVPVQIDKEHSSDTKYIISAGTYQNKDGITVNTVNYYNEVLKDPKASGYE